MKVMERRIRRLEAFRTRHAAESDLATEIRERRRLRFIAEGREPEPDPPTHDDESDVDSDGQPLSLAGLLIKYRRHGSESTEANSEA